MPKTKREKEIEKQIEQYKRIIREENEKDEKDIRYLYLYVIYFELEQLEEELKTIYVNKEIMTQ